MKLQASAVRVGNITSATTSGREFESVMERTIRALDLTFHTNSLLGELLESFMQG